MWRFRGLRRYWSDLEPEFREITVLALVLIAAALAGTALLAWLLMFTDAVIQGHP